MLHPYITGTPRPSLRESEVQVTVHDITGRPQRLRTERDFLLIQGGKPSLPIGIVARHPTEDKVLIEFPHEADSGANRMWAAPESFLQEPPDRGQTMTDEAIRR
jgi:hypothetical protein